MKRNYTIASAKSMVTRNGGKIEGKAIIIQAPGIKILGAIDFLKAAGFYWKRVIPEPKKKGIIQKIIDLRNEIINKLTISEDD